MKIWGQEMPMMRPMMYMRALIAGRLQAGRRQEQKVFLEEGGGAEVAELAVGISNLKQSIFIATR